MRYNPEIVTSQISGFKILLDRKKGTHRFSSTRDNSEIDPFTAKWCTHSAV